MGLSHEFIVREGDVWEQLQFVIRQKRVDLVVTGTHGRGGLGKLLLGFGRHLRIGTTTTVPLYTTAAELRVIDVLAQHDPHARLIGY